MKLFERYTDDYYASEFEIKHYLNVAGIHLILDEIYKYREKYRQYFYYQDKKMSIVLTPKIKKLMNHYHPFHDQTTLHPLIQVFILRNNVQLCNQCITTYDLHPDYIHTFDYIYSFEEDITKSFLEWLEQLSNYSFIKVLNYECKTKQLSLKQRYFLLEHDSYFSIEDYQKDLHITYETARLHLTELFNAGIISRHKVGKKNVYKGVL